MFYIQCHLISLKLGNNKSQQAISIKVNNKLLSQLAQKQHWLKQKTKMTIVHRYYHSHHHHQMDIKPLQQHQTTTKMLAL